MACRRSLLLFAALALCPATGSAQVRFPFDGPPQPANPRAEEAKPLSPRFAFGKPAQEMFDRFFGQGGVADVDEEALAKVEVSWEEETKLGEQALADFRRHLAGRNVRLLEKGREVDYLAKLLAQIRPHMRQAQRYKKLHVYLADMDEVDACALPGGHITFSRGLLHQAQCEAGLVAVAGHELAHLDRGHLLRRTRQWKLAQQSAADPAKGFSPDKLFQTVGLMQQLFQRPFGPAEELEADSDGITWSYELGYDPRAVELVYAAIEKQQPAGGGFLPAMFRTHPPSAERRENLHKTFAALAAADPKPKLYLGRENLLRLVTVNQREFPE